MELVQVQLQPQNKEINLKMERQRRMFFVSVIPKKY